MLGALDSTGRRFNPDSIHETFHVCFLDPKLLAQLSCTAGSCRVWPPSRVPHTAMASLKRKYDWESGQVYHETTVKSTLDLTWLEGPKASPHVRVLRSSTPTLLQTATRTLLNNLNRLPADSMRSVPWHLVADVWQRAQERYASKTSAYT